MTKNRKNDLELFDVVEDLGNQIEWSEEELDDLLHQEGVDPDKLTNNVMMNIRKFKEITETQKKRTATHSATLPLLGLLTKCTNLQPSSVAKELGVSVVFLSDIARNSQKVPKGCRLEIATRAEEKLGVDKNEVLKSLEQPFQYDIAAFRDQPYSTQSVDYQTIVRRSDMSKKEKQFWLKFAEE